MCYRSGPQTPRPAQNCLRHDSRKLANQKDGVYFGEGGLKETAVKAIETNMSLCMLSSGVKVLWGKASLSIFTLFGYSIHPDTASMARNTF